MKIPIYRASVSYLDKTSPCENSVRKGKYWIIEITTLTQLFELCAREGGKLVLETDSEYFEYKSGHAIMIYDDYIE